MTSTFTLHRMTRDEQLESRAATRKAFDAGLARARQIKEVSGILANIETAAQAGDMETVRHWSLQLTSTCERFNAENAQADAIDSNEGAAR